LLDNERSWVKDDDLAVSLSKIGTFLSLQDLAGMDRSEISLNWGREGKERKAKKKI
jgi:hypothetical protein